MPDAITRLYALLMDVVLPHLKDIQASQAEQRLHAERLHRSVEEFQTEMQLRFAEIRAEIALCRQQLEDVLVTIQDTPEGDADGPRFRLKKTMIH